MVKFGGLPGARVSSKSGRTNVMQPASAVADLTNRRRARRRAKSEALKIAEQALKDSRIGSSAVAGMLAQKERNHGVSGVRSLPEEALSRGAEKLYQHVKTKTGYKRRTTYGRPSSKVEIPDTHYESDFLGQGHHAQKDYSKPVRLHFSAHHGKWSRMLAKHKEMYPRRNYSYLDNAQGEATEEKSLASRLQNSYYSTCGINRSGIFQPWAVLENNVLNGGLNAKEPVTDVNSPVANRGDLQQSMQWGLGNGDSWLKFFKETVGGIGNTYAKVPFKPFLIPDGAQTVLYPVNELRKNYEFINSNKFLPLYMSIYIVTPKEDLPFRDCPFKSWYDPADVGDPLTGNLPSGTSIVDGYLMNPFYSYPVINDALKGTSQPAETNYLYTVASETSVVRDATPYLSEKFKEKWRVVDVKPVYLQAGQSVTLDMTLFLHSMTDMKRVVPMDPENLPQNATSNWATYQYPFGSTTFSTHPYSNCFYKDLTYIPMVKFWGEEVVAYDQHAIEVDAGASKMRSASAVSGPCSIRAKITKDEFICHSNNEFLRNFQDEISEKSATSGFVVSAREITDSKYLLSDNWANVNGQGNLLGKVQRWNNATTAWTDITDTTSDHQFYRWEVDISTDRNAPQATGPQVQKESSEPTP